MCGIYAAINNSSVTDFLISGLSSLTYRGYDSAGVAVFNGTGIERRRAEGKLSALSDLLKIQPLDGKVGIAHTRWATHGLPNEQNAHPHMTARVAVAHNGIVENYEKLRVMLESSGYIFESETDSETIAQLITYYLDFGLDSEQALCKALADIEGSFGVVVIFSDDADKLYASRKGSPLILGRSEDGFSVSSDVNAFDESINSITHLKDGDVAKLTPDSFNIFNLEGQSIVRLMQKIEHEKNVSGKQGYKHFMLKEIFEQPQVFENTWRHYYSQVDGEFKLPKLPFNDKDIERLSLVACGTSFFASMVAKYWLEEQAGIPTDIDIASEFRYRNVPCAKNSAALFVSQSGETADTLAALNHCKSQQQPCVSLVNVLTSTMATESDGVMPTLAGPEIGVASTKAFIGQLTTLLVLTLALKNSRAYKKDTPQPNIAEIMTTFPDIMNGYLSDTSHIERVAMDLKHVNNILYLGRGIAYPLAEEGALKLKEITYIHAEAYPSGELKHGPLALVDEEMPVVMIVPPGPLFGKSMSNLREVASRGGKIYLISDKEGISQAKDFIKHGIEMPDVDPILVPLLYTVPLQLLAYYVALYKGHDVDQPRNLAKSVTVE